MSADLLRRALLPIAVLITAPAAAQQSLEAPPPAPGAATATLPLQEVLAFHDKGKRGEAERPPVGAAVTEAALAARLLAEGAEVTARFRVAVLDDRWVKVPLMQVDASTRVMRIAAGEGLTVLRDAGALVLVTKAVGEHTIEIVFVQDARVEGPRRRASVGLHRPSMATLSAKFDPALFRLLTPGVERSDGYLIRPDADGFSVAWEALPDAKPAAEPVAARRAPVEPGITAANASVICTLDGLQLTRVLYQLRLEGKQEIAFTIPEDAKLKKVFVNGLSVPFTVAARTLKLPVAAGRAGEESPRVELLLEGERREFHLSGRVRFRFPTASWSVNELAVRAHLPPVFNYRWAGGSLASTETAPEAEYTYAIPTPGKELRFHQQLVASEPDLVVDYDVDLAGKYWSGGGCEGGC